MSTPAPLDETATTIDALLGMSGGPAIGAAGGTGGWWSTDPAAIERALGSTGIYIEPGVPIVDERGVPYTDTDVDLLDEGATPVVVPNNQYNPDNPQQPLTPPTPPTPEPDDFDSGAFDNSMRPTPPGEPGPPEQPYYPGPPVIFQPGPPDQGGPEDLRVPSDFDIPLPKEPPPVLPPTLPPDVGRPSSRTPTPWDIYEQHARRAASDSRMRRLGGRIIEGTATRVPPILGPIIGGVIDIGIPSPLGSGELPFPPIPGVDIPVPDIAQPAPLDFPMPEPVLDFPAPAAPDVIVVTPTEPVWNPSNSPSPSPQPSPAPLSSRPIWPAIGVILGGLVGVGSIPRPIPRGWTSSPTANPTPTPTPTPEPMPTPEPTIEVRPDPLTPQNPFPGQDPLTTPTGAPIPFTSPFGPLQFSNPTQTDEDEKCRCRKRKNERDPSDTIATVKTYRRRMSNWSLKNLNQGTKAAKLLRKFL